MAEGAGGVFQTSIILIIAFLNFMILDVDNLIVVKDKPPKSLFRKLFNGLLF